MSRNTTTAPVAPVSPVVDDTTDTDTTATAYVPDAATYADDTTGIVAAYVRGDIRRDVARTFVTGRITDALGRNDIAAAMDANRVMTALDGANRNAPKSARAFDPAPYVSAIVARGIAMRNVSDMIMSGAVIPVDVPDDHRDTIADAVRDAVAAITVGDPDGDHADIDGVTDATVSATAYATVRVVGTASVPRHMAIIADGRATDANGNAVPAPTVGTVYTFARIAGFRTSEYPDGAARPNGAVAALFRRDGVNRTGAVSGWAYAASTADRGHAVRFVGTDAV